MKQIAAKQMARWLVPFFLFALLAGLLFTTHAEEPEEYTVTFKSSAIGSKGSLVLLPLDIEDAEEIVVQASSMEFLTGKATASLTAGRYSYKGYKQNGDYLGGGTLEVSATKTSFQFQGVSFNLVLEYFEMENPPLFSELNGTLKYEINKENVLDLYYASTLTLEEIDEHCITTSVNIAYKTLVANGGTSDPTSVRFYYETDDPRVICTDYSISCTGFAASSTGRGVILSPSTPRTIRVPTEFKDSFHVYHKSDAHFYPFDELMPASVTDREDGYTDFSYYMPNAYSFHYLLDGDDEHIKIGRLYSYTPDQTQYTFTVHGYSKTEGDGYDNFDLDNQLRLADRGSEEDNLYLSVPDSNYLVLDSGEDERIEAYRVWEAITDTTGNYFIEPNFHYEVIGDSVSVTEAGAAGREYAVIHAAENGISVIKVTYDAMCWAKGYVDDPENDSSTKYYNAIDPVNTRVVIVRVGGPNATAIDPGITQREYDTIYYDAGKTDHADFTFTPTAADGSPLSVRVHAPLHDAEWGSAWQEYEAAGDGSFTVALTDGRNIIEISAQDGSVEYYVVNCRALQVNVENLTRPEAEDYQAGDTITVSFNGLSLPLQKMAAVYNPNFGGGGWVEYSSSLGQTIQSEAVQYNIQTNNAIQFTLTEPGVYTLADGKIHGTHFGEPLDYHRSIPSGGKTPMLNAPEFNDGYFSTLPELVFNVVDENEPGGKFYATLTIPQGVTLTVRSSQGYHKEPVSTSGSTVTYLLENYDGDTEKATYTWILEKEGYGAEAGTFVIEDRDLTLDLTDVTLEPLEQTEGDAAVRLAGYDRVLRMTQTVEVDASAPADLAAQGYVLYNHGGYTVLHALIEAETFGNETRFDCLRGVFTPKAALPAGVGGRWVCEVNGEECADPANTLLNAGDRVEFYFLAEGETTRAWFTEETAGIVKGESLTLTLMGAESGETAATLPGVPVFVNGTQVGETDADGRIVIPAGTFRSYRSYRVSAGGVNGGTATYALCWLQVTKPETAQGSTTTVTFRLIGDAAHGEEDPAGHEYVTWVPTTAYTFSGSSVTVGQVFAQAMADAGLSYTGLSDNYIDSVTAPEALGGYTLIEMDNGQLSGWMYTVNGFHPGLGLNDKVVSDGDEIVWHYVDEPVSETYDWKSQGNDHATTGDSSTWDTWFDAYEYIPVSEVALDKKTAEVTVGETVALTAAVTPEFATVPTVTWTSSDESVATVDENGVVTGVSVGEAVITAAAVEASATCTVTVTAAAVPVQNITLRGGEIAEVTSRVEDGTAYIRLESEKECVVVLQKPDGSLKRLEGTANAGGVDYVVENYDEEMQFTAAVLGDYDGDGVFKTVDLAQANLAIVGLQEIDPLTVLVMGGSGERLQTVDLAVLNLSLVDEEPNQENE